MLSLRVWERSFAAALYVFGSPTVNMGIGLAYIGVSMPLAESVVPLLFRPNRMIDGFLLDYWVIHIGIQSLRSHGSAGMQNTAVDTLVCKMIEKILDNEYYLVIP